MAHPTAHPTAGMAKVTVHIPHVKWRSGRPRFDASPAMRRVKFGAATIGRTSPDLRHADGTWFTLAETQAWLNQTLLPAWQRHRTGQRQPVARKPVGPLSLGGLIAKMFEQDERIAEGPAMVGKRRVRKLSANTVRGYRDKADQLADFDAEVWAMPVDAITRAFARGLATKLHERYGVASMNAIMAVISRAISWGKNKGLNHRDREHPCFDLELETPGKRIRFGELHEIRALVNAADAVGLPHVGDHIYLGVFTGQRPADRMAMINEGLIGERRRIRQQKGGRVVALPPVPQLEARLAAAEARKRQLDGVVPLTILFHGTSGKACTKATMRKDFVTVRKAAATSCPSVATLTDQDMRDTSVVWLALAGSTIPEIVAITGHSLQQANAVLEHYLGRHPEMAEHAIAKLIDWTGRQKVQL